ncbi:MAG: TadE/TadG family type IV pilus assembly protein [Pseudomonadota bacterium]
MSAVRTKRTRARRARGAVAIEMAVIISMTFVIIPLVLAFGRIFWYYSAMKQASHDAARAMATMPLAEMLVKTRELDAEQVVGAMVARSLAAAGIADSEIVGVEIHCINPNSGSLLCTKPSSGSTQLKPLAIRVRTSVDVDIGLYIGLTQEYPPNQAIFSLEAVTTVPYSN